MFQLQTPVLKTRRFDFRRPAKELVSRGRKRPGTQPRPPVTAEQKAEIERCRDDIVYWVNTYVCTYDPRLLPNNPIIPFKLFPRQEEFLLWLAEREANQEDGLAEKSRDVGFTWLCAADALHGWLFRPGCAIGFGSRKLELVDKLGDPSTIFEKIRIAARALPEWMLPVGFKWKEHDNFARLINPATGATITGEGGDDIGRGGRTTKYFIDEAAFLAHPDAVERALSQTTRCRIWVSTPNGPGNAFCRKRFSGNVEVFTFHWKDDPRKNHYEVRDPKGAVISTGQGIAPPPPAGGSVWYPWYEAEKKRLDDPVTVAQEIDIDYSASIEGICIPAEWVRAAVDLDLPARGELVAGFDVAAGGKNRCVFQPRRGPVARMPLDWGQLNTTQSAWKARDTALELGITVVNYDSDGVGSGIKGTWDSHPEPLPFQANPLASNGTPTGMVWPDGRTSGQRFKNLRAELWWRVRTRFEKTFEYVTHGIAHPLDELISIPNHPTLIAQLSQPLVGATDTGKILIESKQAMAKRGVGSPDFADALIYSEAELAGLLSAGFGPRIHISQGALDCDPHAVFTCGWAFEPNFVWLLGQMDQDGTFNVYACLTGDESEGLGAFGRRVANYITRAFGPEGPDLQHWARPVYCGYGARGASTRYGDAYQILLGGQEQVVGFDERHGTPVGPSSGAGVVLSAVAGDDRRETRDQLVRDRLGLLVKRGKPGLLVAPDCRLVIEALGGGYSFQVSAGGLVQQNVEKNTSAAVVEALGCALGGLFAANQTEDDGDWQPVRSTAGGVGLRRRDR